MNSISLIGNICNDLELKQTPNGKSVLNFNLAVKRPFTKDTTDFFTIVVWNQPAEYLCRYARKGVKVGVSGMLTARKYDDKDGNHRTAYEVVANEVEICESSKTSESVSPSNNQNGSQGKIEPYADVTALYNAAPRFEDVADDSGLPF